MRRALPILVLACSTVPLPPDVAPVDEEDVTCDPLESVTDDSATPATDTAAPLVQWVDPFVGTGGTGWGVGTTYPGPQVPFGMARPGPDTSHLGSAFSPTHCSGYAHDDDVIDGFSHFRLHGAGIADYGGAALMPVIGMSSAMSAPHGHGSHFDHGTEHASPGYYDVVLSDSNVHVELTASARVAFHRYTFPASADAVVIVDAGHMLADGLDVTAGSVTIDGATKTITGMSHVNGDYSNAFGGIDMYFAARFSQPFASYGTFSSGALTDASTLAQGTDVGAYVHFAGPVVEAHVGLSLVDAVHAQMNLDAEDATFDAARTAATAAWEARLSRVHISARSDRDRRIFYTALYHTALMPTLATDVDGSYRGIDQNVHHASFRYMTDFSLWDTYRNLHPLIDWLYPEDAADLAQSLVQMGNDGGFLPRWPIGPGESGGMIGDGATIALADAYVKGVTGFDAAAGYALAKKQATTALPKGGRDAVTDWVTMGYIPTDDSSSSSVSKTLEYAAADDALGNWAAAMGNADDAAAFHAHARAAWHALYDATTHLMLPKTKSGDLVQVNATAIGGPYTEGDAWQYDFMVPFDVDGLETAMTRPVLLGRLEQFFTRYACSGKASFLPNPYYWASNEPDLFSGWIFGMAGDRVRSGRWLRWATLTSYDEGPAGLPGNDDGGTMSAFYVFASLGIYPIPGSDQWVLGAPLFPHATVGTLTIDAPAASKKTNTPSSVTLNGAPAGPIVHHAELANATLHFEMIP